MATSRSLDTCTNPFVGTWWDTNLITNLWQILFVIIWMYSDQGGSLGYFYLTQFSLLGTYFGTIIYAFYWYLYTIFFGMCFGKTTIIGLKVIFVKDNVQLSRQYTLYHHNCVFLKTFSIASHIEEICFGVTGYRKLKSFNYKL